jgi:glycosyltransferase involved in cell wall biosynthesis
LAQRADRQTPPIACFATQGPGSLDEDRIRRLLEPLEPMVLEFDRSRRIRGALRLLRQMRRFEPELVVMEGTGIGGGIVVMLGRLLDGRSYVVSSGDAVGPFFALVNRPVGLVGALYERTLYTLSSGFIGWSPYLAGRALTLGARRAMTAPNWAETGADPARGDALRERLGIPPEAVVFGIAGSLNWNRRFGYSYGLELVQAATRLDRRDLRVLVVGDGDGRERLEELAGDRLGKTILMPGRVPRSELGDYLAAMDVGSLPQSVDGVGSFRYTTKISEYLDAQLPIVTGELPLAYDLDDGSIWRLPGDAPWDPVYLDALAGLMGTVTREEARKRRPGGHSELFSVERQQRQTSAFVLELAERERRLRRS